MKFDINEDNKPYIEARGRLVLNACPGSGKTSAVAYKLTMLAPECLKTYGAYAGIACLSFTNVAKDEIAHKFHQISGSKLDYPHITSTIDSFVNQYITLPFYYLFNTKTKRPTILNHVGFLDDMSFGYHKARNGSYLKYGYPASNLQFGWKPDPAKIDPAVAESYLKAVKTWQYENGYLNNDDSTYLALKLLQKHPAIAQSLIKRFPYIIIDEAQDTSETQYKIIDLLINAGLQNVELVGDPYQSLYEFRKAEPEMFMQRFEDGANWQALRFDYCRRTSQRIIDAYSIFRNGKEKKITAVGSHSTDHNLKVIRYDKDKLPELLQKYEAMIEPDGQNYILVRGTTHLEAFGAKASSENPWKNRYALLLIEARRLYDEGKSKACIDMMRDFLANINTAGGDRRAHIEEIKRLKELTSVNMMLFDFVIGLPTIDDTLLNWTDLTTKYIKAKFGVDIDLQLKKISKAFQAQNIKALIYPPVTMPYPVSTIHKVKGMTFDSVLVVLSEKSSGQSFSLEDFSTPSALPSEKQRMLYVALSRPQTLACIAVPISRTEEDIRSHLGIDFEFLT